MKYRYYVQDYLLALLLDLDGVMQNPTYHPEGDALYHSLQVFQHALKHSEDPILLAAALFHDVGKSCGSKDHELVGAEMISNILNDEITWLIKHHLDLLKNPAHTKKRLRDKQQQLFQLQQLRKWDLAGRETSVDVMSAEEAISILMQYKKTISVY